MEFYGIMLDCEIQDSPYTHPIAEQKDTLEQIESVADLNRRVQLRVSQTTHSIELIGEKRQYRMVREAKYEVGGIYKFTKL